MPRTYSCRKLFRDLSFQVAIHHICCLLLPAKKCQRPILPWAPMGLLRNPTNHPYYFKNCGYKCYNCSNVCLVISFFSLTHRIRHFSAHLKFFQILSVLGLCRCRYLLVSSSTDFPPALIAAMSSALRMRGGPWPVCMLAYALALQHEQVISICNKYWIQVLNITIS